MANVASPAPDAGFSPGSVLWVKCGQLFWPGQITREEDWDEELRDSIEADKRKPLYVVKFFNEDGYEFIYDQKNAFPYNCDRKEEFIRKGIVKSRTKSKEGATGGWFAKFPKDIVLVEEMIGGDPNILEKDPFVERNDRPNYKEVFGSPDDKAKKSPKKKESGNRKRKADSASKEPPNKRPIVHPRFQGKASDHQVKILPQPSSPYHLDLIKSQDAKEEKQRGGLAGAAESPGTPGAMAAGKYNCTLCGFSASRLNVIILHNKTHSSDNRTPPRKDSGAKRQQTPAQARSNAKSATSRSPASATKSSPATPATSKRRRTPASSNSTASAKQTSTSKKNDKTPTTTSSRSRRTATASPAKKDSKVNEEKKPRMTKKKKQEKEQEVARKKEERKQIMGDWSDEEECEEIEKQKIKDVLEPFVDSSEEEEENEDWMMDDNVHGNVYEGEEEAEEKEKEKSKVESSKEVTEKEAEKKDENDKNATVDITDLDKKPEANGSGNVEEEKDEFAFDIGKVLEETSVPSMPSVAEFKKANKKVRKSVHFAEKTKEFVQKNFALVQAESNLDAPPLVDDDFDEFVNDYPIPVTPPKVYSSKRILKKTDGEKKEDVVISTPADTEEKPSETEEVVTDQALTTEESKEESETTSASNEKPVSQKSLAVAADWQDEEEEESPLVPEQQGEEPNATTNTVTEEANQEEPQQESTKPPEEQIEDETSSQPMTEPTDELSSYTAAELVASEAETVASAPQQQESVSKGSETIVHPQVNVETSTLVTSAVTTPLLATGTVKVTEAPATLGAVQDSGATATATAPATVVTTAAAATSAASGGEETYLILVDDGTGTVDSLNSQTLYIDPSHLANGDLSNMVLMTNEGVAVSASAAPAGANQQNILAAALAQNNKDRETDSQPQQ